MDYLLEAVQRLAPHPLGGRIRGHSLRMGLFQLFQPAAAACRIQSPRLMGHPEHSNGNYAR